MSRSLFLRVLGLLCPCLGIRPDWPEMGMMTLLEMGSQFRFEELKILCPPHRTWRGVCILTIAVKFQLCFCPKRKEKKN